MKSNDKKSKNNKKNKNKFNDYTSFLNPEAKLTRHYAFFYKKESRHKRYETCDDAGAAGGI